MPTKPYTFTDDTDAVAAEVNANFDTLYDWANADAIHRDASVAFTAIPSGPASDPTSENQFVRKAYVDQPFAVLQRISSTFTSGAGTQGPITTFSTVEKRGMTTSGSRITVITPGLYEIGATFGVGTNTSGIRGLMIRKNGVNLVGDADEADQTSGFGKRIHITDYEELDAGDYLDVTWKQSSGETLSGRIALWAFKIPGTS
jgi:hypothetical protein